MRLPTEAFPLVMLSTFQVTPVWAVPVTVALKIWVWPWGTRAVLGDTVTATAVTVTVAESDWPGSAPLVTLTVWVPAAFGAV